MKSKNVVQEIVSYLGGPSQIGGQAHLARKCGVKPQAVQKWIASGRVPAERVLMVSRATGGRWQPSAIRPDIYSAEGGVTVEVVD